MKKTWQYFCFVKNQRHGTLLIQTKDAEEVLYDSGSTRFRQGIDEQGRNCVYCHAVSPGKPWAISADSPMNIAILLIDDDKTFRRALRLYLENCGLTCQEANDGLEALALLDNGLNVDLILSDYHMPIINGLSFLKALSYRINGQNVRVILLSGNMTKDMEQEAKQAGAFEVLAKPCDHQELLAMVFRACKK